MPIKPNVKKLLSLRYHFLSPIIEDSFALC